MFVFLLVLILAHGVLLTVTVRQAFRAQFPKLAVSTLSLYFISVAPAITALIIKNELAHPFLFLILFAAANVLLIACAIVVLRFGHRSRITNFFVAMSAVMGLLVAIIVYAIHSVFGTETLYRKHIFQDYFFTISRSRDNGYQFATLTRENMLFVTQTINAATDPWAPLPVDVRFLSFEDPILKFELLRPSGTELLVHDVRFDQMNELCSDVRIVTANGKCGAVDASGKVLIPLGKYKSLGNNYCGLLLAWKGGKRGFVDRNGRVVIGFRFDSAGEFSPGSGLGCDSATVEISGRRFVIDRKGNLGSVDYRYDPGDPQDDASIPITDLPGTWSYRTEEPCGYYEIVVGEQAAVLFSKELSLRLKRSGNVLFTNDLFIGSLVAGKGTLFLKMGNERMRLTRVTALDPSKAEPDLRNEYEKRLAPYCR